MPRPRTDTAKITEYGPGNNRQLVLLSGAEVVCPWCLINRMRNAGMITPAVAQDGRDYAALWNCAGVPEDRQHTHRFPIGNLTGFWECETSYAPTTDDGYD